MEKTEKPSSEKLLKNSTLQLKLPPCFIRNGERLNQAMDELAKAIGSLQVKGTELSKLRDFINNTKFYSRGYKRYNTRTRKNQ